MSVGFAGEAKIWKFSDGIWKPTGEIPAAKKAGELWAITLDSEGHFLVGTTHDGRNNVWELVREVTNEKTGEEKTIAKKFAEYETRGGFGLAVDVVSTSFALLTVDADPYQQTLTVMLTATVPKQHLHSYISPDRQYLRLQQLHDPSPPQPTHPRITGSHTQVFPRLYPPCSSRRFHPHINLRRQVRRGRRITARP